jgi:hypothetical protein
MATSAERMRALRERQRRGLRKLRIEVSEDDLREIAQAGYEGAAGLGKRKYYSQSEHYQPCNLFRKMTLRERPTIHALESRLLLL